MARGAGLMSRFDGNTSISTLLRLQVLFRIRAGTGANQAASAEPRSSIAKSALEKKTDLEKQ
jgi:hypothetical protein